MRFLLILALSLLTVNSVMADGGCEAPWLRLFDKCYGLFGIDIDGTPRLSWHKAEKNCNQQGGTLAVIKSREVQSVINALLLRAPSANVWIGLNDLDVEDTFKWTDGTGVDFKNWAPDQPDDDEIPVFAEDCVYLQSNEDFPGEWNDGFCDYSREYICQKPLDPSVPDIPTRFCQQHMDYTPYHRSCFKIYPDAKNFSEAVNVCEEDGTIIASIDDAFQEAFVETLLMNSELKDVWIGLQTRVNVDWLEWVDLHPVKYTNWDSDLPVTTKECAILSEDTLRWSDQSCDETHPVICKHYIGQRPVVPGLPKGADCPVGMDSADETFCLKTYPDELVTYEEAKMACETNHPTSTLASVHLKHELSLISKFANSGNPFWIGLHKTDRDQFAWEDGSVVNYVSFAAGEPSGDGEKCVEMKSITVGSDEAEWSTFECVNTKGYACRAPILLKPPETGGCMDGWYLLGDRCFKSVGIEDVDRQEFKDAQDYCAREKGGRLFQITSQGAQSLLSLLLQDFVGKTNLWIGLSDTEEEGSFVWTDGTPLGNFTQWAPNQPDGFIALPNEPFRDCVEVKADPDHPGEWDDINCRERRGYICEAFRRAELSPNPIIPGECDAEHSDYVKYRDSCFKIIEERVDFNGARQKCLDENATLAKANDGFYNALMTLMISDQVSTESVWISLAKDNPDRKYTWQPGQYDGDWPFMYAHWAKGMPNGKGCTVLNPDSTWSSVDCTDDMYYPMCEYTNEIPDPPAVEEVHCAEGWVLIDRQCYIFTTITPQYPKVHFTWDEAEYECRTRYGRTTLPSLHSESASQEFADNAFRQLGRRNIWLGIHRSANGYYVWDDDSILDYVNWDSGSLDPSNDCTGLQADLGGGKWSSEDCFTTGGLACQAPALPGRPNLCPTPWQSPGGVLFPYCYLLSGTSESSWLSWHEATSYCNQRGGYLASMNPREEYIFVLNLVKRSAESYWIGLNDIDVPGTWVWQDGTAYNGAPSLWARDDIRDEFKMQACVLANPKGLWEDHNCGIRMPFICKWDPTVKDPIVPTKAPDKGGCETESYRLKDRCYDLSYADLEYTWMQAHSECIAKGGHLAAIHDHGVQALLSSVLKNIQGNVWIGLSRFGEFEQYHWSDGATLSYTNWALGEPNGPMQQQNGMKVDYCGEMVNNPNYAGKWNDVDCTKKNGFICQKALDESLIREDLPYKTCPSNSDYIVYEGSCFKVAQVARTHGTARDKCEEDNAILASIADGFEQAFIEMLLVHYDMETAWIGLTRGENDQFVWIDDWPVVYTGWDVGYPASSSEVNRCVVTTTQGWRNVGCYESYGAVCKINTAPKPSAPPPPSGQCQQGWSLVGDTCLFFDTERTAVSYVEGMAFCQAMEPDAYLASVHDSVFNNILRSNALNQLGVENVWLGLVYQKGEFTWADGSPVDYTNWGGDQPSMPITGEICVQMAAEGYGVWKNTDCFVKAGYICQAPRGDVAPSTSSAPTLGASHPPEPQQGLSTGKIVGIAIGSGVGFVILVAIVCYYREKKQLPRESDELLK